MDPSLFQTLDPLLESNDKPLTTFKDPRIAGLQAITDLVFSNAGSYKDFNSVDITEFFRIEEQFSAGYERTKSTIENAINSRLSNNHPLFNQLTPIISAYSALLEDGNSSELELRLQKISKGGIDRPLKLLSGTYLDPDSDSYSFEGERVLITGSDTGIGRATALEFARRGAKVALHYPTERFSTGAFSVVDLISESGREAQAFPGDFRDLENIKHFTDKAIYYLGGLDVLVNNAGITLNKPFEDTTPEDFHALINANLGGTYFVSQSALPHLIESKGQIINLSSPHGIRGMPGHSVYAATKGSIASLTTQLALEFTDKIRVNSINPVWVTGSNHFYLLPDENFSVLKTKDGRKEANTPENFANDIARLASRNITGQNIGYDGLTSADIDLGPNPSEMPKEKWGGIYM